MMNERGKADNPQQLAGLHLLIVEDDFIIAMELESLLRDAGARSVGVCRTVNDALAVVANGHDLSAAVFDVRLGRSSILPVARQLAQRAVPFVFYTAQFDLAAIREEWPGCAIISKPASAPRIVGEIVEALKKSKRAGPASPM